jgi:hypothetical protein
MGGNMRKLISVIAMVVLLQVAVVSVGLAAPPASGPYHDSYGRNYEGYRGNYGQPSYGYRNNYGYRNDYGQQTDYGYRNSCCYQNSYNGRSSYGQRYGYGNTYGYQCYDNQYNSRYRADYEGTYTYRSYNNRGYNNYGYGY